MPRVSRISSISRTKSQVVLFSMDPDRDTPEALTAMAKRHEMGEQWTLVQPTTEGVSELAAALGIRYRQLPSKDFNHSQVIALLDADGTIVERAEGLGPQRDKLVKLISKK